MWEWARRKRIFNKSNQEESRFSNEKAGFIKKINLRVMQAFDKKIKKLDSYKFSDIHINVYF